MEAIDKTIGTVQGLLEWVISWIVFILDYIVNFWSNIRMNMETVSMEWGVDPFLIIFLLMGNIIFGIMGLYVTTKVLPPQTSVKVSSFTIFMSFLLWVGIVAYVVIHKFGII